MQIELCRIDPDGTPAITPLSLPQGARVAQALAQAGLAATTPVAIFNRRTEPEALLAEGDRLDILSPIRVDPIEARRLRAEKKDAQNNQSATGRHGGRRLRATAR